MGDSTRNNTLAETGRLEVEAVLFDFEGTLVNFQWQLKPAVEECVAALEAIGFKREWYGPSPNYATIYNETLRFCRKGRAQADASRAMDMIDAIYDKYDADAGSRWALYPDTLDMLSELGGQGFQMGLVSNIGKKALHEAMDRLALSDRLIVIISRNDVEQLKPHAGGLIQAAAALAVRPAHTIFIGDSRKDVVAARHAGMLAGFLNGGEDSRQAMREAPADIEINRLSELPKRLARMDFPSTK